MQNTLKRIIAAQADLIDRAGGIELAAEICGYSKSQVGRWHHRDGNDLMAMAAVIRLETATNSHFVTAALVAMHGAEMVPAKRRDASLLGCFVATSQAEAAFNSTFAGAIGDGIVTGTEQRQIDGALSALITAAETTRAVNAGLNGVALKVMA